MNIFDINYILFKILNYPVSFLELTGTITNMACVYLTARERVICWPVGIVGIVLFFIMFYQVRLYSDMLLQVYFLAMSLYGWWMWTHPKTADEADGNDELRITVLTVRGLIAIVGFSFLSVFILGFIMKDIHIMLPMVFPKPAAYPFVDAFTTVFSITATILMALKKRECWLFWVAVDIVAIFVYFFRGINLVAIEYFVFGIIAAAGYYNWNRQLNSYQMARARV